MFLDVTNLKCVDRDHFWRLEERLLCPYLGEAVPEDERTVVKDAGDVLSAASSVAHLPLAHLNLSSGTAVTDAERVGWEEEKQKLYQQLDDKVIMHHYATELLRV